MRRRFRDGVHSHCWGVRIPYGIDETLQRISSLFKFLILRRKQHAIIRLSPRLALNRVGVEKLGARRRVFPQAGGSSGPCFSWESVPYVVSIAVCAVTLRNRTSRFRFCATAAR